VTIGPAGSPAALILRLTLALTIDAMGEEWVRTGRRC
jgi:hypothetical protein